MCIYILVAGYIHTSGLYATNVGRHIILTDPNDFQCPNVRNHSNSLQDVPLFLVDQQKGLKSLCNQQVSDDRWSTRRVPLFGSLRHRWFDGKNLGIYRNSTEI